MIRVFDWNNELKENKTYKKEILFLLENLFVKENIRVKPFLRDLIKEHKLPVSLQDSKGLNLNTQMLGKKVIDALKI